MSGALIIQPGNHLYDHSYVTSVLRAYPDKFVGMLLANPTNVSFPPGHHMYREMNHTSLLGVLAAAVEASSEQMAHKLSQTTVTKRTCLCEGLYGICKIAHASVKACLHAKAC